MNITEDKLAGRTALERYLIEQVDTAVANHNITVYYQPIIQTITGKISSLVIFLILWKLRRFQEAGYSVLLDDFGQGNSSLNVLKNNQFEALKIDLRFLAPFSPRAKTIIDSVVCMAKKMGTHALAEGVETKEQADFLTSIGCEQVQEIYFGRPMPVSMQQAFMSSITRRR
ncbi:MAG: EAL domain-containing protein [Selenomonadaceae bacterium]|nr:EAL domain-containing protein [Selenomonadaceae bacterium]